MSLYNSPNTSKSHIYPNPVSLIYMRMEMADHVSDYDARKSEARFGIEVAKLIASLRAAVDGQERRIRHLEKLLFGMALPRAVEPAEPLTNTGMGRHGAMSPSQRHPFPGCGCGSGHEDEGPGSAEYGAGVALCGCGKEECSCGAEYGTVVATRELGTVETEKEEE